MFWSMKKRRERENPRIAAPKMAPTDSSLKKKEKKYSKTLRVKKIKLHKDSRSKDGSYG